MTKKLEEIINEISGGEGGRISDLNFAYHNSWLLDKLRLRGDHIKYQQWDKLNELNRELTAEIQEKKDTLIKPKCAFVSMESETAYNHLAGQSSVDLDFGSAGKKTVKVSEAPEPTNVIWENRDFDRTIRYGRLVLVIMAVLVVLFITFLATVQAKAMSNDLIGKYDDSINCKDMSKMYPPDVLQKLAADEWTDYY